MKILVMLLILLASNTQAQNNSVPLTRSENHASFAGKGVATLQSNANKASSSPGLHVHRNMPPMGENSEGSVLAKKGGIRRMPALGGKAKQ